MSDENLLFWLSVYPCLIFLCACVCVCVCVCVGEGGGVSDLILDRIAEGSVLLIITDSTRVTISGAKTIFINNGSICYMYIS